MASACSRDVITTAHDLEVKLVGTDAAYCILSTKHNRYAMVAPGTALVERDGDDLKVDCKDNLSDRRRTLIVESEFSLGYWSYPEHVTVNFSSVASEAINEGFRAEPEEEMVKEVLTEDSYSMPITEEQKLEVEAFNETVDVMVESAPVEIIAEPKLEIETFDSSISQDIAVENAPVEMIEADLVEEQEIKIEDIIFNDGEVENEAVSPVAETPEKPTGRKSYPIPLD